MWTILRLYLDSVLVGLALAILVIVGLVLADIGGIAAYVLAPVVGARHLTLLLVFVAGVISSLLFFAAMLRWEIALDRAIEQRKRSGWGQGPRDKRR